jgi:cell division protein FtsB
MYVKFAAAAAADEAAKAQLEGLNTQRKHVEAQIEALTTDRGLEGEIRERYGVARPGEGQIDIVREAGSTTPAGSPPTGFWAKLWHAIFVW